MLNVTKITIAWELFERGVPKAHIAKQLTLNRETIHLWICGIQSESLLAFLESYANAKKGERSSKTGSDPVKPRQPPSFLVKR